MASSAPIVDRIRIIPRPDDFLDRNVGSSGEVFFNKATNSIRVFSGKDRGGFEIAKADLSNVDNDDLIAKLAQVGGAGGGASVDVSATVPSVASNGNLWLNTENGSLYIYINDGDSSQWIQPSVPTFSGNYNDLTNKPDLFSGDFNDLINVPNLSGSINDLTDVDTQTNVPSIGQVLKWNGTNWGPANDIAEGGAGLDADTLDGQDSTFYLNYNNLNNTPTLATVATTGSYSDLTNIPTTFSNLTLSGNTTIQSSSEVGNSKTGATGTVEHDLTTGAIWDHTSIAANFTVNFTNVPTTNNRATSALLILNQGASAYLPISAQIDGVNYNINWSAGAVPTPSPNKIDAIGFSLLRFNNTWSVIASLTVYG